MSAALTASVAHFPSPGEPPTRRPRWRRRGSGLNQVGGSLDHLVGTQQEVRTDRQAERSRRLEIDDKLEFHRLLDRQVGGLRPVDDLFHVAGEALRLENAA